jgi:hypothetical protein
MATIHITINAAEDRQQPTSRNQASKCSFCGFTAVTNAKYKHEIEAHQDETLARALAKQEQHKSLSKTDLISLIGPDEQGKFLDYGLTLPTLQMLYEQLRTSVHEDVAQVQQDVAQVQQDVVFVHEEVAQVHEEVAQVKQDFAHFRHSFADVLETVAGLQRVQQEQQQNIRRVEDEQQRQRDVVAVIRQLQADIARNQADIARNIEMLNQEVFRENM